jgi:hypothetical protein
MSTDTIFYVWIALTVLCVVVFVIVLILLPNTAEFEFEFTEKPPPDKADWAGIVLAVALIWLAIALVCGFIGVTGGFLHFLLFSVPILFLFFAVRLGRFAYRFKINHVDCLRKKPKDIA